MVAVLLVSSCQKELPDAVKNIDVSQGDKTPSPTPTPTPDPTPSPELKLNKNDLSFTEAGGSETFSITSNTSWSIASDQEWCMVSSSSGSNNATVTVNVSENTSTDQRSATITVRAGNIQQTIAVTQLGAKVQDTRQKLNLRFISDKVAIDSDGENGSFPFTHDGDLSKLDESQFECWNDNSGGWEGVFFDLSSSIIYSRLDPEYGTSNCIYLKFKGNKYYYPDSTSISILNRHVYDVKTFSVNGVSFKMIRVDGGTFTMGATSEQGDDAADDEFPTHRVTLSTYYIGETEVTQALWEAVMGSNPSSFSGSRKPVECVGWDDCWDFVSRLNSMTGMNFRLPTEAEWEFAARGGNSSQGYKYAGSNTVDYVAWYSSNSDSQTHDVATRFRNELGLYDMSGNVFEWCQDMKGSYSSSSQTNPTGPSKFTANRVLRGGAYFYDARYCRVSARYSYDTYDSDQLIPWHGLRLAL